MFLPFSAGASVGVAGLVLGAVLIRTLFRIVALLVALRGTRPEQRAEILAALAQVFHPGQPSQRGSADGTEQPGRARPAGQGEPGGGGEPFETG